MPRKDRDVWDPPEDQKVAEEPPSAFLRHFQDRAVRVGRDGSNAQLVRLKRVPPVRWSRGEKNGAGRNSATFLAAKRRRGPHVAGGITAPGERGAILPPQPPPLSLPPPFVPQHTPQQQQQQQLLLLQQLQHVKAPSNGVCGNIHLKRMGVSLGGGDVHGSLQRPHDNKCKVVTAAPVTSSSSSPSRLISSDSSFLCGRSKPSDVIAVESIEEHRPLGAVPFSRMYSNATGTGKTEGGFQKPLTRLPPRRISVSRGDERDGRLMPKSLAAPQSNPAQIEQRCNKKKNDVAIHNGNINNSNNNGHYINDVVSTADGDGRFSFIHSDDASDPPLDESETIPLFLPTGRLLLAQPNSPKRRGAKKAVPNKRPSCGGGGRNRAVSDKGHGICPQRHSNVLSANNDNARLGRKISGSAPLPGKNTPPARLQPLPLPLSLQSSTSKNSNSALASANDDEQREKEKKGAYKPYNLKDYKLMMEHVANLKLGGLGPANTEEQRQAKERMERQRQYGELVEKQASEKIREAQQQRLLLQEQRKLQNGSASEVCVVKQPQQPPPPERIQAQERRARALEYARNLPRPEPPSARREAKDNDVAEESTSSWRTPQDEAAWHRERRLKELEAKHQSDRERVSVIKRQLGY